MVVAMIALEILIACLLLYAGCAAFYNLALAAAYFLLPGTAPGAIGRKNTFAILIPSHNEELLIGRLMDNLLGADYPAALRDVYVIADNCTDRTAEICAGYLVRVLTRDEPSKAGKGFALDWALDRVDLDAYDAIVILDADTTIETATLNELNAALNRGERVMQCCIKVPNRAESWFTQLIAVSRTVNDLLYHSAKHKLGLSSYLMGTGMCFSARLLKENRWKAYSLSEDWEYYAELIGRGIRIGFAEKAVVQQQESSSLNQATTQRLRWASGRFYVVKRLGFKLLAKGIASGNLVMADASLALLFPNWSLLINLILLSIALTFVVPASAFRSVALASGLLLLGAQGVLVLAGIYLCGNSWATVRAIMVSPLFLVWKMLIDVLCLTGIYRGKKWIRTRRHIPSEPDR